MPGDTNFTGSEMVGFIFSKLNWTGFILEWSSLKVDLLLTAQSSLFSTRPWCSASVHPPSQTSSTGTKGCATKMSSSSLNCSCKPGWIHAFMFKSDPDSRIYNLLSSNCISLWVVAPVSCSGMTVSCYCSNLLQDSTCSFTDALLQNLVVTSSYSM